MRAPSALPASRLFTRFRKAEHGTTAIEFAIVATPFLMFIFALIGIAFNFFILSSTEKGMDQASRLIRTGQAQAMVPPMTVNQFKQKICDGAGSWIQCNKLQVFVNHYPNWAAVQAQACVDNAGNVISNSTPGSDPIGSSSGGASEIVIVTACYKWVLTSQIPYLKMGNMSDGSLMMQSATAFRAEPYQPAS